MYINKKESILTNWKDIINNRPLTTGVKILKDINLLNEK